MKRPITVAAAIASVALITACEVDELSAPAQPLPVLRAFLYADEPVTDIRLTWTTTLDPADTVPEPINDAQVTLIRNGVRYDLVAVGTDSGTYSDPSGLLVVREGDVFDLEAQVGSTLLTARTSVPVRPTSASVSLDTLIILTLTFTPGTPGTRPDLSKSSTLVSWTREPGALYYVVVENTEASPEPADTSGRFLIRRTVFAPTSADTFRINGPSLKYYGRHRVRVYRINEEYAQLYATLQQDSRDLNEPISNVRGGLGVFSAFSSDTAAFIAVRQQ